MITINFLQHRRNFIELFVYFINRIKPENKKKISINFLTTDIIDLSQYNISVPYQHLHIGGNIHINNYKQKFITAMEYSDKFFVKMDEDIILSNHLWDYIIENVDILETQPNIIALTPATNIGVMGCEIFIDDFCNDKEKQEIYNIFLKQDMQIAGNRWGTNFRHLNKYTLEAQKWERENYLYDVSQLTTQLKGIHPVRISYEAQMFLYNCVLNNISKFLNKQNYSVVCPKWPYLCNDISIILTSRLWDIYKDKGFEPYDEIPMNIYKQENNLDYGYIKQGYALHTMFAFVSHYLNDKVNFEQQLYEKLRNKIYEYNYYDL